MDCAFTYIYVHINPVYDKSIHHLKTNILAQIIHVFKSLWLIQQTELVGLHGGLFNSLLNEFENCPYAIFLPKLVVVVKSIWGFEPFICKTPAPIFMVKLNSEPGIGGASSRPGWNASNISGLASSRAWEAGSSPHGESCEPSANTKKKTKEKIEKTEITNLRVATWNVGTLKPEDTQAEVCVTLSRWRVDICGVQEHRWLGCLESNHAQIFKDKDSKFKFFYSA